MKKLRVLPKLVPSEPKVETASSNLFVFCEKTTGVAQFRAESTADLDCAVERLAGIFAMQCLVHGQNPADFVVMVPAERSLVERLMSRAADLLQQGRAVSCPASLSPRQREILDGVISSRANKEIAGQLNISERTVKFHVSALLSKFRVTTRTELARRAAGMTHPETFSVPSMFEERLASRGTERLKPVAVREALRIASKPRNHRLALA